MNVNFSVRSFPSELRDRLRVTAVLERSTIQAVLIDACKRGLDVKDAERLAARRKARKAKPEVAVS